MSHLLLDRFFTLTSSCPPIALADGWILETPNLLGLGLSCRIRRDRKKEQPVRCYDYVGFFCPQASTAYTHVDRLVLNSWNASSVVVLVGGSRLDSPSKGRGPVLVGVMSNTFNRHPSCVRYMCSETTEGGRELVS